MSELGPSLTYSAEADFRPRRDHGSSLFRVELRKLGLSACDSRVTFDDEADAFAKDYKVVNYIWVKREREKTEKTDRS